MFNTFKKYVALAILPFVFTGFLGCSTMQKAFLKEGGTSIADVDMEKVKHNLDLARDYMAKFKLIYDAIVFLVGKKVGGQLQADAVINSVDNALRTLGEKIESGVVTDDVLSLVKISLDLANQYLNAHQKDLN